MAEKLEKIQVGDRVQLSGSSTLLAVIGVGPEKVFDLVTPGRLLTVPENHVQVAFFLADGSMAREVLPVGAVVFHSKRPS